MTIRLYIKTPAPAEPKAIGTITEEQLTELVDLLEEEGPADQDYYIDKDLLDYLEQEGADPALVAMLKPHITGDEGIEVVWRKEE